MGKVNLHLRGFSQGECKRFSSVCGIRYVQLDLMNWSFWRCPPDQY